MGAEQPRRGKLFYLCVACLIFLLPAACTWNWPSGLRMADSDTEKARAHMISGRKLLAQGNYAQALRESEQVLSFTGPDIPRDESLFYLGLIYVHPANPGRDYGKSLASLRKLIRDYPRSPFVEQAKIMADLLQENEKLDRKVEKLNRIIIELKEVDIGVDQKRRETIK